METITMWAEMSSLATDAQRKVAPDINALNATKSRTISRSFSFPYPLQNCAAEVRLQCVVCDESLKSSTAVLQAKQWVTC